MAKKNGLPRGSGVLLGFLVVMLCGGIYSAVHGGNAQPSMPDNYSTILPAYAPSTTDTYVSGTTGVVPTPATPTGTGGGNTGSGGGLDLPGYPYIDGPDIHCHLSGCHIHVGPRIGFHR